jgi:GTPase SAR1 family protein
MSVVSELAEGARNLDFVVQEVAGHNAEWNEAETRFQIIDRILIECLGWSRAQFRLEKPQGRKYSDYELGEPVEIIWEAKREGKAFEVPVRKTPSLIQDLGSIIMLSPDAKDAIEQVNGYCLSRGVRYAVATNGHQFIAFRAQESAGSPERRKCLFIESLSHLQANFPRVWQALSPGGVLGNNLDTLLDRAEAPKPPQKLSVAIPNYPQFRQPTNLQRSLSDVAELLLLNIEDQPDIEKQFYANCYCESGALNQHALISKQMLRARYEALFPEDDAYPRVEPVVAKSNRPQLTPEILADAISNRPIALIGDVGVGKSSFLKHLMYVSAFEEFQHALYVYVDLGRKGALSSSLNDLVLDQIEKALLEIYNLDVYERNFVKAVYKQEIKRFDRGIYGDVKEEDPALYNSELRKLLGAKQANRPEHIKTAVNYLANSKRKQIIIALDNADQRTLEIQQEAFVIAQTLAADWKATVFISIRPRTFYASKRSGALSAYPHRVFTVAPPRIDAVIAKRLTFALNIAEGRYQLERLRSISFQLGNIAAFIKVLLASIEEIDDVKIFLENITGGNIRELIELIAKLVGNPNVDTEGAIRALESTGSYFFPAHEFWKVALKGEYQYYDPEKVMAANLFAVQTNRPAEHFLTPLILGFLDSEGAHRSSEGFVKYTTIVSELQSLGFEPRLVEGAIRAANNKKLVESPNRVTFEEDENGLHGAIPDAFRINTIGAYHLKVWMTTFAYLDAVCVDVPLFDEDIADELRPDIRSFALQDRYKRALKLRSYLSDVWNSLNIDPDYFDWEKYCAVGQESFTRVQRNISKRGTV